MSDNKTLPNNGWYKTEVKCPECREFLYRNKLETEVSNPKMRRYMCLNCGFESVAESDNEMDHIAHGIEKIKYQQELKYKPIDPEEKAWVFGHNDKVPEDIVNHPSHYETGKFECFDVMREAFGDEAVKNFCICNAFKYLYRHQRKNGIEDIRKAKWYIDHFLEIIDEGLYDE